ncbi:MAG: hypothetical protein ACRCWO_12065 [Bosea sp. (in: a-proteobacteria)]
MSKLPLSNLASSDFATLAELARDGSLDLTSVAFRVRTDLMVALDAPTRSDLDSFLAFAAAALPKLSERDTAIITQKLAAWPQTPPELKSALILRQPGAAAMFERKARREADPMVDQIMTELLPEQPLVAEATVAQPRNTHTEGAPTAIALQAPVEVMADEVSADIQQDDAVLANQSPEMRIDEARLAMMRGDDALARAILADPALGPAAQAAFFLLATPVQQSLMLSGLGHLDRSRPRLQADARQRAALERILDLSATDRTGAFLALSDVVGGSPEFAARITLDDSRKLAGLCIVAIGGNDEDAVRFALRLADEPACSVETIFALADMARQTSAAVAARLVRAIGGTQIASSAQRAGQHVPAADPSSTPQRQGGAQTGNAADRRPMSPQEAARRLLAG